MWIRRRLDIGWRDLFCGIAWCFIPARRDALQEAVKRLWPDPDRVFVCFSVRTGFDLLLKALSFPPKSEVLVSALTLPDMVKIIREHDLVPVPVDIHPGDMAPRVEDLQKSITSSTRALLVAHLYGAYAAIDPVVSFAKEHDLVVIEDCAQAYDGASPVRHPEADCTMYSFGTIKTATALGGAVFVFRDGDMAGKMEELYASYPVQSRASFLRKILKYTVLKPLTYRIPFAVMVRLCRALALDYDAFLHRVSRGFPGPDFFRLIRKQPSVPLLALMRRRFSTYDYRRLERQRANGRLLARLLEGTFTCPGTEAESHVFWVFPVLAEAGDEVVALLRKEGFDATRRQSLCVVESPGGDRPRAERAERMFPATVFLPFYAEIPEREIRRMAGLLVDHFSPDGNNGRG